MGISLNITNTMIFGCVWTLEVFHVVWSSVISWTCPMFSDFQSHFMGIYWNTLFVWSVIYLQYMVVSLNKGCPQIQNYTMVLSHLWWLGDPLFQEALKIFCASCWNIFALWRVARGISDLPGRSWDLRLQCSHEWHVPRFLSGQLDSTALGSSGRPNSKGHFISCWFKSLRNFPHYIPIKNHNYIIPFYEFLYMLVKQVKPPIFG